MTWNRAQAFAHAPLAFASVLSRTRAPPSPLRGLSDSPDQHFAGTSGSADSADGDMHFILTTSSPPTSSSHGSQGSDDFEDIGFLGNLLIIVF